jgi:hypothetical protein
MSLIPTPRPLLAEPSASVAPEALAIAAGLTDPSFKPPTDPVSLLLRRSTLLVNGRSRSEDSASLWASLSSCTANMAAATPLSNTLTRPGASVVERSGAQRLVDVAMDRSEGQSGVKDELSGRGTTASEPPSWWARRSGAHQPRLARIAPLRSNSPRLSSPTSMRSSWRSVSERFAGWTDSSEPASIYW